MALLCSVFPYFVLSFPVLFHSFSSELPALYLEHKPHFHGLLQAFLLSYLELVQLELPTISNKFSLPGIEIYPVISSNCNGDID